MEQGTYELKYCERCGSLGTRRAHSSDTYCESCAQILTHAFLPGAAGRRPRLRRAREPEGIAAADQGRSRTLPAGGCNEASRDFPLTRRNCCWWNPHDAGGEIDPRPEMLCFRGQTLALIRHFFEISSQVGRVSSLLGREFFRSRVSHHAIPSFEEQAVFVRDVELCLEKLGGEQREVLTLLGLYDYSYDEVSQMMHCSRTLVRQWFNRGSRLPERALSEGAAASRNSSRPHSKAGHAERSACSTWPVRAGNRRKA